MKRPEPRAELAIFPLPMSTNTVMIAAVTSDAQGWIEREAPIFGKFEWVEGLPYTGVMTISLAFDPNEVVMYLLSFLGERPEVPEPTTSAKLFQLLGR